MAKTATKTEKKRLQFTPTTNVAACCDPDSSRYVLGAVQICPATDTEIVYATATDGRCLAITTVVCCEPATTAALCPGSILKPYCKTEQVDMSSGVWQTHTGKKGTSTILSAETPDGRYPRVKDILPSLEKTAEGNLFINGTKTSPEDVVVLKLNPDLLSKIKLALIPKPTGKVYGDDRFESQGLTLIIRTKNKKDSKYSCVEDAMMVVGGNGIGVLMPMTSDSEVLDSELDSYSKIAADYTQCQSKFEIK